MIEPRYIRDWITRNTHIGTKDELAVPTTKRSKPRKAEGLTEDGLIPRRNSRSTQKKTG